MDVTANNSATVNICATSDPTPDYLAMVKQLSLPTRQNVALASNNATANGDIVVDLYLHTVAASHALEDGWVTVRLDISPMVCHGKRLLFKHTLV